MSNFTQQVQSGFLAKTDLTVEYLQRSMESAASHTIDYSDIYIQNGFSEYWGLEDQAVKRSSYSISGGLGVRTLSGEKTGFAYADTLSRQSLDNALSAALSISQSGQNKTVPFLNQTGTSLYAHDAQLNSVQENDKIQLLRSLDEKVRALEPRAIQVNVGLQMSSSDIIIVATDGTLAADNRPMVRIDVSIIVEASGRREQGSSGFGGRYSWQEFMAFDHLLLAQEAVERAQVNLESIDAPAGNMPVVLGSGWPGVLLHEAVGHGLEADFNRKGSSAYSDLIGQQVAAKGCTVIDEGCIAQKRGSLNVDDEGTPTQKTVLIEDGILKGYLQDKHNARLMGMPVTGNGRRQSYAHLPMPRMTNTYMQSGSADPESIIRSVKKGIYATNFAGGQVDITSGNFVFSASQAFLIEDGKITAPIKGATLMGNGPEVLKKVSMVGNDSQLDQGIGVCGKSGQSVPVCVGQPTLKIDDITVGGTQL